jgi:hypothetical protein
MEEDRTCAWRSSVRAVWARRSRESDPRFVSPLFRAALDAPEEPWSKGGVKLGDEQFEQGVADNRESMREWGAQAVVWQTAVNPVIAQRKPRAAPDLGPAPLVRWPVVARRVSRACPA